jgi:predicted 3-demethylubiquinone-9 3-methyltransferase (glyoxalase superfamily)
MFTSSFDYLIQIRQDANIGVRSAEIREVRFMTQRITASLWFEQNLEEAMNFYVDIFPDSAILERNLMPEGGMAPAGSLVSSLFRLNGTEFIGINGGPYATFNESVSFRIHADTQEDIDYYWTRLTEGGEESACGWLKDRFGLSWQVVPEILLDLLNDPDPNRASRVMKAMLEMTKIDIPTLIAAADAS